jgi:hypothetical protein
MRWRLLAGLAVLFLVPFLAQRPAYVASQYEQWLTALGPISRVGLDGVFAQLFGMLAAAGLAVSTTIQTSIRAGAALLTIWLCADASRRHTPAQAAVFLFALNVCYLMLFSTRTENNTYSALAPALAVSFAQEWSVMRRPLVGAGLALLALGILGSYELGRRLAPGLPPSWLAPLMGVCFMAFVVFQVLQGGRDPVSFLIMGTKQSCSRPPPCT